MRRRRRLTVTISVAVLLVVAIVAAVVIVRGALGADPQASDGAATPDGTSTPADAGAPDGATADAVQALLDSSSDPEACAVSFAGDGITDQPVLETQGLLFANLPIPEQDGRVFAGWYASDAAAAAYDQTQRVNGSQVAACTDRRLTLHGAWKTPAETAAEGTTVPILMYHQFTTNPDGEDNSLKLNYTYIGDFAQQIGYLADERFYLPTWPELSAFIDGRLFLPQKSVIVTDDDADKTWLELAVPVVTEKKVLTTSFVITKWRTEPTPSVYVLQRSHTHDMHEAGDDGQGRMVNWTAAQVAADMETSAQILGAKEVMAYPFGHNDATAKEGLREAGFEMARTVDQGYVTQGTEKLALPCIRINYGMSLDAFIGAVNG